MLTLFFPCMHCNQSISKSYVLYLKKISLRYFFSPYITISCVDFRNNFITDFSAWFFTPFYSLYKMPKNPRMTFKKSKSNNTPAWNVPRLSLCIWTQIQMFQHGKNFLCGLLPAELFNLIYSSPSSLFSCFMGLRTIP